MKNYRLLRSLYKPILTSTIVIAAACGNVWSQETEAKKNTTSFDSSSLSITSVDPIGIEGTERPAKVQVDRAMTSREFVQTAAPKTPFRISPKSAVLNSPGKQNSSDSGWQFAFAPYLYMTGVTGTIGARGRVAQVDLDFADVLKHLNLGLMGAFEARKRRLVLTNDLIWIKLGEERDTPGQLYSSVKLGVNLVVIDPEIGYRLYDRERGSFDVVGGVRIMSVENNVNFRAGILPADDVSERKTWGTPVIGGRGIFNLTPRFFLSTKFDVGGGIGADFTGQFYGGGGFRLTRHVALIGGYRYLRTNYDSNAGFIFDTTMNGILMGAKFSF